MDDVLTAVLTHARTQDHCITTRECGRLGLSRKRIHWLVRNGHWKRMHQGVYVVHSGAATWRQRARAALLYAGTGAALSHEAAGYARELVTQPPRVIDVSIPASRRVHASRGIRITRRTCMPPTSGRLRSTNPEHTVIDLLDRARSVDDAVGIITQACRRRVSPWAMRQVIADRGRLRHRRLVADLIAEAHLGIESPLERRYHHDVERAHGLPTATLQARAVLDGRWTRADRRYAAGVRVELDGQLAHPDGRTDKDTWRDNAAAVQHGDLTLRYRWIHVVSMTCEVAAQVVLALRRQGWTGEPRPCGPACHLQAARARAA
ncbi:MAG: type IV toxin-antitoxin system AbiEi family antitoxin domain-containing protein [Actinomycetales bacterium]|nr:type IV toxin-antitoxin system AbiEi family antitoxin domain-containing protein [Actinomycetales bacterium]